ncbi:MAG: OsmC family protein [Ignavibacteriaceae bacterium]
MPYNVKIEWKKKEDEIFTDKKYSRAHKWTFDSGIELKASSSPHVVPLPYSDENAVDPEEAFVAAVSSCHMLSFLPLAADKNYIVKSYEDNAEGVLAKNKDGILSMTKITLKPKIVFIGDNIPTKEKLDEIHHKAHEQCFIANSVNTRISIVTGE